MYSPYINTILSTSVSLKPRQMDNYIYKHLKDNLIKKVEGRCYREYGYIKKVYKIEEYGDGIIVPENPLSNAVFNVKFHCRICYPLKNKEIICKIEKINSKLINCSNGPITCIIELLKLMNTSIISDVKTGKIMYKDNNNILTELKANLFIKVNLTGVIFNDKDSIIMSLGNITGIANEKEIEDFYNEEYKSEDEEILDFNEYKK